MGTTLPFFQSFGNILVSKHWLKIIFRGLQIELLQSFSILILIWSRPWALLGSNFWRMMMMMNCFCGMIDRRKASSLISSRDHCQRSSPSRISDTPRAGFEPAQNLGSGLVEWNCAVVITTTPRRHFSINFIISALEEETDDKRLCVKYSSLLGRSLLLLIREYWSAKKELKSSAFFIKSITN